MSRVFQTQKDLIRAHEWRRRRAERRTVIWHFPGRGLGFANAAADGTSRVGVRRPRKHAALVDSAAQCSIVISAHENGRCEGGAKSELHRRDADEAIGRHADTVRIDARLISGNDPALDVVVIRRIGAARNKVMAPLIATQVRDLASLIAAGAVKLDVSAGGAA